MESLISQLGLAQEILELHKSGMNPPQIREQIRENHPTFEIIPSVPAIYVFLRDAKELPPGSGNLTGNITEDTMALNMRIDELMDDVFRVYSISKNKRKYISTHRKKVMDFVKEFQSCYGTESRDDFKKWQDTFLNKFDEIVLTPLTMESPAFLSKRAQELMREFVRIIKEMP